MKLFYQKDGNCYSHSLRKSFETEQSLVERAPVEGRLETNLPHANDLKTNRLSIVSEKKTACGKKATS